MIDSSCSESEQRETMIDSSCSENEQQENMIVTLLRCVTCIEHSCHKPCEILSCSILPRM